MIRNCAPQHVAAQAHKTIFQYVILIFYVGTIFDNPREGVQRSGKPRPPFWGGPDCFTGRTIDPQGGKRMSESLVKSKYDKKSQESWNIYLSSLEDSLKELEKDIDEAANMTGVCTDEWCEAIEHVIDDLNNSLFAISEPRWATEEDSRKIKKLKKRVYDLYAKYKQTAQGAGSS